jgi:hypothetical protein
VFWVRNLRILFKIVGLRLVIFVAQEHSLGCDIGGLDLISWQANSFSFSFLDYVADGYVIEWRCFSFDPVWNVLFPLDWRCNPAPAGWRR